MSAANPLFDAAGGNKSKPTTPPTGSSNQNLASTEDDSKQAVELIRSKISQLYSHEPDAKQEAAEAEAAKPRSKHQEFMHSLSQSGKTLVQIQTAWHDYYQALPEAEKHQVWQEFYENQGKLSRYQRGTRPAAESAEPQVTHAPVGNLMPLDPAKTEPQAGRNAADIKNQLLDKVAKRAKIGTKAKHQLRSLGFGLAMGAVSLVILMFGFFNERFIAPFVTPSRTVSSTPIITDVTRTETISSDPVIIIPKINIEIPVVYDEPSIDEAAVQRALERGVLHYPTTENPGEQGNAVFFGHSSSNILNNGKYKFAFVLLNRLETGDTVMLQKDGKRYIYRVFEKKIVAPTEFSVLNDYDKPTATLITCDPPGTATNRLVVVAEQISPDPATNVASSVPNDVLATPESLPSNAPSLWSRLWGWLGS